MGNVVKWTDIPREKPQDLQTGGGGGTYNDMETRVANLESKFDKMDSKLDTLIRDMSYLRGKVDSLPTTLQLLGFVLAVLAIAGLAKYFAP